MSDGMDECRFILEIVQLCYFRFSATAYFVAGVGVA